MEVAYCWRKTTPEGMHIQSHIHDAFELVYYERGVGTSLVGGRDYNVNVGSITLIPPGILHDKKNKTEISAISLGIRGAELEGISGLVWDKAGIVRERCSRLVDEVLARRHGYRHIAQGLAFEILGHVERLIASPEKARGGGATVAEALGIIREREGVLTVRELAEALHVSKDYLRRLFQEHANGPAVQHILKARVDRARRLLADPGNTCADVAYGCGFESAEHFSRLFRRLTGMSPSQYRKGQVVRNPGNILPFKID